MTIDISDTASSVVADRDADPKRWAWLLGGLWVCFMPFFAGATYFATGGALWAVLILPIHTFVMIPIVDFLVGEDPTNPPEEAVEALSNDPYYRRVIYLLVVCAHLSTIGGIWFLATQAMPLWALAFAIFGLGVANAIVINLAHELGHKTNKFDQFMAKVALSAVGYGHFCIEHNHGHHVNVSTPEDTASSRMGETVYEFAFREMPGGVRNAWIFESNRLRKQGLKVWSRHNRILQSNAGTVLIALALTALFGWKVLPILVAHHFVAWWVLTIVNYIEHYGLLRKKMPNGKYEPCQPHHSWNTNHIVSNVLQIHLQRHSDHHANPMRPYQVLRNYPELPRLPSGYPGCMVMASFPPLWFWIMDRKLMAWSDYNLDNVNIHERARKRLERRWGTPVRELKISPALR